MPISPALGRDAEGVCLSDKSQRHRSSRRRRRWRRRVLRVALLMVALVLLAAYAYVANPQRAAALAVALMEQAVDVRAQIQAARFDFDGTIRLQGLELHVRDAPRGASRLLTADHVVINHNTWGLLKGRFEPSRMLLRRPCLYLTQDTDTGRFNYESLTKRRRDAAAPLRLPAIVVEEGSLQSGEVQDGHYRALGQMRLDGGVFKTASTPGAYQFNLVQKTDKGESGPVLSGRFDLDRGSVAARLEKFSIHGPQRDLLPGTLRQYWDQLEPAGSLTTLTFDFDPDPAIGLKALLELQDAAISLPITEPSTRLSSVVGRIEIDGDTIRPDLSCQVFHEQPSIRADCTIKGWIHAVGADRKGPFELAVESSGRVADIKDEPLPPRDQLPPVSKVVRWLVDHFAPRGRFVASFRVARRQRGEDPSINGDVKLFGNGYYSHFPYPLHDVSAVLKLRGNQLQIARLAGIGPGGANVQIHGVVKPLRRHPQVQVHVDATDVRIDDQLFDAIRVKRPQIVPAIDMFMDHDAYGRLVERLKTHLAKLDAEQDTLVSDASVSKDRRTRCTEAHERQRRLVQLVEAFRPGGAAARMVATVDRPEGRKQPVHVETELDMAGVSILFRYWPYPIQATGGTLIIKPDRVVADNIEGRGLGNDAVFSINGTVRRGENGWGDAVPQLTVTAQNVPIDDVLLATVPEAQRGVLRALHLSGRGSAVAHVFRKASEPIDFTIQARIDEGQARPNDGRFVIDLKAPQEPGQTQTADENGGPWQITIGRHEVLLNDIEGLGHDGSGRDPSPIRLSGSAAWRDKKGSAKLQLAARKLVFHNAVLDLLPPEHSAKAKVAALFATHQPRGTFDADVSLSMDEDGQASYELDLRPHDIAFDLRGTEVQVNQVQGRLLVYPDRVAFDSFSGSFGPGRFTLGGQVQLNDSHDVDLRIRARADQLCDTARACLPAGVLSVIDRMELAGPYEVKNGHLVRRSAATAGLQHQFEGELLLDGASAVVGLPIKDVKGVMQIHVHQLVGASRPVVNLTLAAEQLTADEQLIRPFSVIVESDETIPERLNIHQVTGECHGGRIVGSGWINLGAESQYDVRLTLQGAALQSMLGTVFADESARDGSSDSAPDGAAPRPPGRPGRLDGSLAVTGVVGKPASRMGRGEIRVREAYLYTLPSALKLLQLMDLSRHGGGRSSPIEPSYQPDAGIRHETTLAEETGISVGVSSLDAAAIEEADIAFVIDGDLIRFDRLNFLASDFEIAGTGTMRYSTKQLDLDMVIGDPQHIWSNPMSELLNKLKDELFSIHVGGTLDKPQMNVQNLRGIKRSWNSLFGVKGR